ncbi:tyrosine-type recombinase/integrase [Defluviicoccus vanus]|uniref:Tyrosine-type recombinase/integrase n=1 Tax=Defluviicoccus vanus TaxID=111831 RepID=A0A7H1MZG7_9PROT|nr:tyrosine-type recombinase/integrase [Defluviicoccus vanus]
MSVKNQGTRRYIWRSLRTADRGVAEKAAAEFAMEVMFHERYGLSLFPKRVASVIDEWLAEEDLTPAMRKAATKSLRYWKEWIGDRLVTEVGDLSDYLAWRRGYWKRHSRVGKPTTKANPADRTLVLEVQTMRRVFAFARRRGWLAIEPQMPVMKKIKRNRRPALTPEEQQRLKGMLENGWADTPHRWMIKALILTLLLSGIRIGEARTLRWSDLERTKIDGPNSTFLLKVNGKTGEREVVAYPELITILLHYKGYLLSKKLWRGESSRLFADCRGQPIRDVRESWHNVCEKAGIGPFALYCLRHTYITNHIKYSEHPDVFLLARNCGTSVEMIEKFYSDVRTRDAVKRLTQ